MRILLIAGVATITLAGPLSGTVHAADIYYPPPNYSAAPPAYEPPPPPAYRPPPPRYGYAPPPAFEPPPVYAPAPRIYGPPPVVAYEDDEDVIVAPPRHRYRDYAERPRFRDCWSEWGERRCGPRRGW